MASMGGTSETARGRSSWALSSTAWAVADAKASTENGAAPPRLASATGEVPATTDRTATIRPPAWCRGRAATHRWPSGCPARSAKPRAAALSADAGSRTPAGFPVEPDVAATTATSAGTGASGTTAVEIIDR